MGYASNSAHKDDGQTMSLLTNRPRGGRPLARAETDRSRPQLLADAAALGTIVRAERVARGLSQGEMAARLGVSRGLISALEGGGRGVRMDIALRILADLGVRLLAIPEGLAEGAAIAGPEPLRPSQSPPAPEARDASGPARDGGPRSGRGP